MWYIATNVDLPSVNATGFFPGELVTTFAPRVSQNHGDKLLQGR